MFHSNYCQAILSEIIVAVASIVIYDGHGWPTNDPIIYVSKISNWYVNT